MNKPKTHIWWYSYCTSDILWHNSRLRFYVQPLFKRWACAIHRSPEDGDKNSLDSEYIMQEYVSLGWSISCKPCHDPMVYLQSLSFLVLKGGLMINKLTIWSALNFLTITSVLKFEFFLISLNRALHLKEVNLTLKMAMTIELS